MKNSEKYETPKFTLSNELSQVDDSALNMINQDNSDIDIDNIQDYQNSKPDDIDNKADFVNANNIKGDKEKSNQGDISYIFDLKDDCTLTLVNNNPTFKPSLSVYRITFEKYIKNTEQFLNIKYKTERKRTNIPYKLSRLKTKMLAQLVNEVFIDHRDIILYHKFARDLSNNIVKKKISYVFKFAIPNEDQEHLESLLTWDYNNIEYENEEIKNFLKRDIDREYYLHTLQKVMPDLFSNNSNNNYTSDEYRKILEDVFKVVNNYDSKLYRVFRETLLMIDLNFIKFIKTFCIFVYFAEEIYSKIKIVGKELHVELFCDDDLYLKKCEQTSYNLELSDLGKKKLMEFNSFRVRTVLRSNQINSETQEERNNRLEEEKYKDQIIYQFIKTIFIPYSLCTLNLFTLYDTQTDIKINGEETDMMDPHRISILRNVDRTRILYSSIHNCLNLKCLNLCHYFIGISMKRDIKMYKQKKNNYVNPNFNILSKKSTDTCIRKFRDTYGEEIAYYLAWTHHLLIWVSYFYCIILLLFILQYFQLAEKLEFTGLKANKIIDLLLTIVLIMWFNFYISSWKAGEKARAIQWGTFDNSTIIDTEREDFESDLQIEIFSSRIPLDSMLKNTCGYITSFFITLVMSLLVISSMTILLEIQSPTEKKNLKLEYLFSLIRHKKKQNESHNNFIPYLIGLYIKLLQRVFDFICRKLTEGENHQKESSFRSSYITKNMIFNMINHYFTFYYIIIVRSYFGNCSSSNCAEYLSTQLFEICLSYFFSSILEMLLIFLVKYSIRRNLNKTILETYIEASETQLKKIKATAYKKYSYLLFPIYDQNSIIHEYIDTLIFFGYITQFGLASPFLFLFFTIYTYIKRIIDAEKFSMLYNIHLFEIVDGIGNFKKLIKFLLLLSTFINIYLFFFVKGTEDKLLTKIDHWYSFIITENFFIFLIFFMDFNLETKLVQYYKKIRDDFIRVTQIYIIDKVNITSSTEQNQR